MTTKMFFKTDDINKQIKYMYVQIVKGIFGGMNDLVRNLRKDND